MVQSLKIIRLKNKPRCFFNIERKTKILKSPRKFGEFLLSRVAMFKSKAADPNRNDHDSDTSTTNIHLISLYNKFQTKSSFAGKFMSDLSKAKDKALKELDKVKAQADKYLNMESTTDRTKKDDVKERSRQLVADDVYLYTTKTKDPVSFLFELGADKKAIKVTLNFAGSENFKALDAKDVPANDLRLTGTVAPHERQILGSMVQINRKNAGKLCMDYSWEFVEPDRSTIKASVNENQERVAKLLEKQHSTPTQEGHFIDLAFPPCE